MCESLGVKILTNEYLYHDDYAELLITGSKYGDFSIKLDKDMVEVCKGYGWHVRKAYGRKEGSFYIGSRDGNKTILIHRFITGVTKRDDIVDHINGDALDNRKENLRVCDHNKNAMNKGENKSNKSGRKGVFWYTYCKTPKWMATIKVDSKTIHLGYFEDFEEACDARQKAEEKYFGEFNRN